MNKFWILLLIFVVGCTKPTTTENKFIESRIDIKESGNLEIKTIDLSEVESILSYPTKKSSYPLILILNEENTYNGFKYLRESLVQNGYVVACINLYDMNKSIEEIDIYLKNLKDLAIHNEINIDFDKIGIIGFGESGEILFDIANNLKSTDFKLSGLLSIAPTNNNENTKYLYTDINTSIIVPEIDGEVINLDGYAIFDKLNSKKRENSLHLTLLEDANHNFFNDNLNENDSYKNYYNKETTNQISRENQKKFLENYSIDFFNYSLKDEIEDTIYDIKLNSVDKMYGLYVKNLSKNSTNLVNIKEIGDFESSVLEINKSIDSMFFKDDTAYGIIIPNSFNKELLNIRWNEDNQKVSFNPKVKNFLDYNFLSIDIVVDPMDELNKNKDFQKFSISLEDKDKNISIIHLDENVNALEIYEGEAKKNKIGNIEIDTWNNFTFLSEIKISLDSFEGVDLENITKVNLIFNDSGSIMIENIGLK